MTKIQAVLKETMELHIRGLSRTLKIAILFAALLTLALFTAGFAQTPDKTKLDQFFDRLAEKNKAMGSLNITKDGKVLYTRSIGYSQVNGTEKKPLTAATRYRVGSVTKMFAAAMIFQLIEEGKLKMTDHLDKFFPQNPNANKITIAQILAHRSGIHDVSEDQEFRTRRLDGMTKDELLALIVKSKPDFEPGAKYAYSNSGFQLLGMLVEKLTGNPYAETLKERITSKIGLKDTYVDTRNIDASKTKAFPIGTSATGKNNPKHI
jgi:CubicO group peptidase (beta-lactamase class C family)